MNRALQTLTPRARKIIDRAEREARDFGHTYIGTEHVLLALVADNASAVASALRAIGVDLSVIRSEVEKLVARNPAPVDTAALPLTPRTRHAIELAADEAWSVGFSQVDTEYLLLGLMREPDGVAGLVLRNLGLPFDKLREQLLRIRMQQMQIVERAVRPVRAGTARKRKMREEMLAHLTAIYEQALDRLDDPHAALHEAAERFGDPAELSRELDAALPAYERRTYFEERLFGWRAPESVTKWMARLSAQVFLLLAVLCIVGLLPGFLVAGGNFLDWKDLRILTAFLVFISTAVAGWGLAHYKMRDAMFGVFGSRKSPAKVLLIQGAIALFITACGAGYFAFQDMSLARGGEFLAPYAAAGVAVAITARVIVRFTGPGEIRDTLWACLDINDTPLEA